MPAPPTPPSLGSSVTQRRAGLANRSRCTGAGKPTPARATRRPCANISCVAARVSSRSDPSVTQRPSYAIATSTEAFFRPAESACSKRANPARAPGQPWIDFDFDHLSKGARGRSLAGPRREDLLGHRAGRIPGSCAHLWVASWSAKERGPPRKASDAFPRIVSRRSKEKAHDLHETTKKKFP